MADKKINPTLKLVLELGPVALFFITYSRFKDQQVVVLGQSYDGFILATALFIPVLLISTGIIWWLSGKLSKMQMMTAALVLVFGGMSVWFNDERFFKMKPTIIYLLFGGLLGVGLLRGQSYLRYVLEEALPMRQEGWMKLTRRMCAFFFALAAANELVWRTMSTDAWVTFKTFGLTLAVFGFFIFQASLFKKYAEEQDDDT